jgi:hypothetical protein
MFSGQVPQRPFPDTSAPFGCGVYSVMSHSTARQTAAAGSCASGFIKVKSQRFYSALAHPHADYYSGVGVSDCVLHARVAFSWYSGFGAPF